jgi:acyl carrier protein
MNHRSAVLDRVTSMLCHDLGVPADRVIPTADLRDDLGLDSIDLVELVTGLEEQLDDRVPQDSLADLKTIDDVVDLVCKLTADQRHDAA